MMHATGNIQTRHIGPLTVSALGLGCMNLSHGYGVPPSAAECARLLNHALDLGVTFLDTAAIYGGGENEKLLGTAVMHRRQEFVLATKGVLDMVNGERVIDGRPETLRRMLDRSLQHLRTDHIGLYYLHRLDRTVPIEDSVGELSRAVDAGKIRHIGLSEMSAATIRRAHAVHPIAAIQTEYSPWVRNPEIAVLNTCRDLSIGFVAFSPVARGFLAGAVRSASYAPDDIRAAMPRFLEPQLSHNLKLYERFRAVADGIGCTPAQLALAWVLARGHDIVPIPGTRSIAHLEENLGALNVALAPEAIAAIDDIFRPGAVQGGRYSPAQQAMIDTELLPEEQM